MSIIIDTKITKFVEGTIWENNIISIKLTDIDETFFFDNEVDAQDFVNKQVTERSGDKSLRKGYFDYKDETGELHRYWINKTYYREIVDFREEVIGKIYVLLLNDKERKETKLYNKFMHTIFKLPQDKYDALHFMENYKYEKDWLKMVVRYSEDNMTYLVNLLEENGFEVKVTNICG